MNHLLPSSLMIMAKPTSMTIPTVIKAALYNSVLRMSGHSLSEIKRNRKFSSPHQGLPRNPLLKLNLLNATMIPPMGI